MVRKLPVQSGHKSNSFLQQHQQNLLVLIIFPYMMSINTETYRTWFYSVALLVTNGESADVDAKVPRHRVQVVDVHP